MAGKAADVLSDLLKTKVEIERVQIGLLGRVIVDDLRVWDQKGDPMLQATRTAVKIDIMDFISDGNVIINSAQLFGATAHISKAHPDSALNCQFVIDAFASKDTTHTPLPHIELRSILIRHTELTYDNLWQESKPSGLDKNHIAIKNLSVKAAIDILNDDTLSAKLDKLSFEEKCGFSLTEGTFELTHGKQSGWVLDGLHIALPQSAIETPRLQFHNNRYNTTLSAEINPSDLSMFYAPLQEVDDVLRLQMAIDGNMENARLTTFKLTDGRQSIDMDIDAEINGIKDSIPTLDVNINKISLSEQFEEVISPFFAHSNEENTSDSNDLKSRLSSLASKIGTTEMTGHLNMSSNGLNVMTRIHSNFGDIDANGLYHDQHLKAHAETNQFNIGEILNSVSDSTSTFGHITTVVDVDGTLKGAGNLPEGNFNAIISEMQFKGYTYHDINASVTRKGEQINTLLTTNDPAALTDMEFLINTSGKEPTIQGYADIRNLDLHGTNLVNTSKVHQISAKMGVDFQGNTFDNMAGNLSIPHIIITDEDTTYTLTSIQLISEPKAEDRHVQLKSPYLSVQVDGHFTPRSLATHLQQMAHNWIPGLINAPTQKAEPTSASINMQVKDLSSFQRLLGTQLQFNKGPLVIDAAINSDNQILTASANAPSITYDESEFFNLSFNLDNSPENMHTKMQVERLMKGDAVTFSFDAITEGDKLNTRVAWDNHKEVKNKGEINLRATLEKNSANGFAANAEVLPSDLYINDTLWNVHPAHLNFQNKQLNVDGLQLSMNGGERSLSINGIASQNASDTLTVDLKEIDLEYIFTLAKVKPLTLAGYATGRITAQHVFKNPYASGSVVVPHFLFNQAHMGYLNCYLAWGDPSGTLSIKGHITDPEHGSMLDVNGGIHLIKDPVQHLDLSIDFTRANAAFMQRYVNNIMHDFQGRITGNIHVFGQFKNVDIEGDALVHECGLTIPSLNVRYFAYNENISLRPGYINLENITAYDRDGKEGQKDHCATVNGRITYEYFRNMHFNFDIEGRNILAYDTKDFGDMPFYATAYGTGNVKLNGGPGYVNIDINATPDKGTSLTYKVQTPETITNAGFVTYVNRSEQLRKQLEGVAEEVQIAPTSDMYVNFNLNLTPEAQLRLLMDPRTEDYITLYGESALKATYYNKGRFQMYGTYRVDHGTYKMTLQDVIHKDFQFRKGGTIIFGGNPFNADLGLQAIYTVPSVSLNDLSARGTFSNSNVRVNCIMNLGGKAGAPRVTFDFDIPNVNEDEARMVRSLISTEEERNMQVIYLLGIGRFYTYDYTGSQAQSSTAMNSLLSSTLSGQLNQMLNSITGNSNWNIGANLSTGTMGWSDMDVEGMLSGRLLNNRLLINGNFGYRDNPVAASNFIGDFDVQWLLTKNGNLILKAYSETNDRYFTKSALTTQGIGLMVKKDFSNLQDLFGFLKKRRKTAPTEKEMEKNH